MYNLFGLFEWGKVSIVHFSYKGSQGGWGAGMQGKSKHE